MTTRITPIAAQAYGINLKEPAQIKGEVTQEKLKAVADRQWAEERERCQLRRSKSNDWLQGLLGKNIEKLS